MGLQFGGMSGQDVGLVHISLPLGTHVGYKFHQVVGRDEDLVSTAPVHDGGYGLGGASATSTFECLALGLRDGHVQDKDLVKVTVKVFNQKAIILFCVSQPF